MIFLLGFFMDRLLMFVKGNLYKKYLRYLIFFYYSFGERFVFMIIYVIIS